MAAEFISGIITEIAAVQSPPVGNTVPLMSGRRRMGA